MDLYLYNTQTRRKEIFHPLQPDHVRFYACGPTVYSAPHIGNARAALVFDVLFRLLSHLYKRVSYVRNITDVDDKILQAAEREHKPPSEITRRYEDIYQNDMKALGVLPPTHQPRVTENMPEIIAMIQRLLSTEHAYQAEGHVLFSVDSFSDYGCLSGRDRADMLAGARVEVAAFKRDPADFVLWKPSTVDSVAWDSPWGRGRPGWHIECSAMAAKYLGETIDIHGGGRDLIFPHHENELAQSTCAHGGKLFSRYWVHNGMIRVRDEKMSKSKDNVLLLKDVLQSGRSETVRYAVLSTHYHQPLSWTQDAIRLAQHNLDRLYGSLRADDLPAREEMKQEAELPDGFLEKLTDDCNTPAAFGLLQIEARRLNSEKDAGRRRRLAAGLYMAGDMLGLLSWSPEQWFTEPVQPDDWNDEKLSKLNELLAVREAARKEKDYDRADQAREELRRMGVSVRDSADGPIWSVTH